MLISKLGCEYKTEDPSQYLIGAWQELDPVFAGRLAYLAKVRCVRIKMTEGYRSTARQAELYNMYLEYKQTGKGSIHSAAKPGTSWHEFRLAVDTSTQPVRGMGNEELKQYGLCKPIKSEGWHIQPIETSGQTNRKKFEPVYQAGPKAPEVKEEEEMTEEQIRKIIQEEIRKALIGANTSVPAWAAQTGEWTEAQKDRITDGTRPGGYATRAETAAMIQRAKKIKR